MFQGVFISTDTYSFKLHQILLNFYMLYIINTIKLVIYQLYFGYIFIDYLKITLKFKAILDHIT